MATTLPQPKKARNPSITNLKTFGRAHRDEPWYGFYKVRIYPKKGTLDAEELAGWCGERYLNSNSRSGKAGYRIGTYRHSDGNTYVDRLFLVDLTDREIAELTLRFGDWLEEKVVRDGLLRRPKLTTEEKKARDALIDAFYMDIERKRMAKIQARRDAGEMI